MRRAGGSHPLRDIPREQRPCRRGRAPLRVDIVLERRVNGGQAHALSDKRRRQADGEGGRRRAGARGVPSPLDAQRGRAGGEREKTGQPPCHRLGWQRLQRLDAGGAEKVSGRWTAGAVVRHPHPADEPQGRIRRPATRRDGYCKGEAFPTLQHAHLVDRDLRLKPVRGEPQVLCAQVCRRPGAVEHKEGQDQAGTLTLRAGVRGGEAQQRKLQHRLWWQRAANGRQASLRLHVQPSSADLGVRHEWVTRR